MGGLFSQSMELTAPSVEFVASGGDSSLEGVRKTAPASAEESRAPDSDASTGQTPCGDVDVRPPNLSDDAARGLPPRADAEVSSDTL
jgi:hypothetical protein